MSLYTYSDHWEAHFDIYMYAVLHGRSVQFSKGGGDMTTYCQKFDELCSSMENFENSGNMQTLFVYAFYK